MIDLTMYAQAFSNRGFRRFWTGFTLSSLGDAMSRVALTWYVWETTRSPGALALLTACYTGPVVVGGLMAGWLLDRFDRRRVMQWDCIARGVTTGVIPVLYALGALELWHVYVAASVYGFLFMVSLAGSPAIVPSLVPERLLPTANALETLSFYFGGVVGPPLAGLLVSRVGAPTVLVFDALTYFVFAAALRGVRPIDPAAEQTPSGSFGLANAFGFVARNAILRSTTLMYMSVNVGIGLFVVWLPVYADELLGGGAGLYGVLLSAEAIGSVASSFLAGAVRIPTTNGRLICSALILSGASLAVAAAWPNVPAAFGALFLFGLFSGPLTIWAQTLRMRIIPAEIRGRVFAILRTMMQGATPAGGALGGMLIASIGVVPTVAVSAGLAVLPGVAGFRVGELVRDGAPADASKAPAREDG
jgi:MFS family permease